MIDDDGVVVWESVAIIRYLAARYGRGSLWIDSPIERAAVDQWIEWCQTAWQRDFMDLFWAYYRTPDSDRNMKLVADKIGACTRHVETMDRVLAARPYLCGDKLTLGDIPAGAQLYRYFNLEIARPIAAHVTAWYKRLLARPGYRDHVAIPFDELRARLAY